MSYSEYTCPRCGDTFGIAGESTGSDEDFETDRYYSEQVEWHRSGECSPVRSERQLFADGLRALAAAIEVDSRIPLPNFNKIKTGTTPLSDDDTAIREVTLAADAFGTPVELTSHGHHLHAHGHFGPVHYEVTAVLKVAADEHAAASSYYDNIRAVS